MIPNCPICNSQVHFLASKVNRLGDRYDYLICKKCRFLFEKDLVENSGYLAKKVSNIYQKDYFETTDVGWKMRGDGFLKIIKKIIKIYRFFKGAKPVSVLDYGGGNGYLASKLSEDFDVLYYDKFEKPTITGKYKILEKPVKSDIMYAVELVEHITNIKEWDFLNQLSPDIFIFTTGLSDNIKKEEIVNWEYLHVDGGHMAIYSCQSLYLLGRKYGFVYFFFPNISCHIFIKSRVLSRFNFVEIEYGIYSIFRKIIKS